MSEGSPPRTSRYAQPKAAVACHGDPAEGSPAGVRQRRLHVTRAARQLYALPEAAFGLYGRVLQLDFSSAGAWAQRINEPRRAAGDPLLTAAELMAGVTLHELAHALIAVSVASGPLVAAFERAHEELSAISGAPAAASLEAAFVALFSPADASAPLPRRESQALLLEELLLLALARDNPAFAPFAELFDSPELVAHPAYPVALAVLERRLGGVADGASPGTAAAESSLLWLLRAPQRRAANSLLAQLRLAVELWGPVLGERFKAQLEQALRSADLLAEEAIRGPLPPGPSTVPELPSVEFGSESVAYSPDSSWMPEVAMVAKSAFVWLTQLSRRYGRTIGRLDEVPDEALADLREDGFNALWLIGLWQRSEASRTIKRLRGQADAVASAYSIYDYVIAPELGGEPGLLDLRRRAGEHGLRLASDMVPNHTGIDGRWVIENPERFVQLSEPPFPGYRFTGPDLSGDERVSVRIEDRYYDGSDAAVVFERVDNASGASSYLYHGNDGTHLPWNDTAQLDFLRADVREAVIQEALAVARDFPIIRFDAAMTLAKQHVRRLWHPAPGEGGAIPSRSNHAISEAEFERLMPREFWRELVERMALEAPDSLLLAEAFWLMESYFVRTLGLHRVYNSAFMHMMRREDNAKYRALIKEFLLVDPRVLERFVNFMSNPDEESVLEQFGGGDKQFGVAVILATLPGLPLFAHGQVEGLAEKYGMEFLAPKLDEAPREQMMVRHRQVVAPLLRERRLFAGTANFRLFDFETPYGGVNEDVYLFTNRGPNGEATLVAYNNSPRSASGTVNLSVPFLPHPEAANPVQERLSEALGWEASGPFPESSRFILREHPSGAEVSFDLQSVARDGLRLELGPYQASVLWRATLAPAPAATDEDDQQLMVVSAPPAPAAQRCSLRRTAQVVTVRRRAPQRRRNARRRR